MAELAAHNKIQNLAHVGHAVSGPPKEGSCRLNGFAADELTCGGGPLGGAGVAPLGGAGLDSCRPPAYREHSHRVRISENTLSTIPLH